MDYHFRISQEEMRRLYENAKARADYNPDVAEKYRATIEEYKHFDSEKEALEYALKKAKNSEYPYHQIWAKIEKVEDIFRVQNWWIATKNINVKMAADYLGLALMYDDRRMQTIVGHEIDIDDVVSYY